MIESLRVEPGSPARISERDPRDTLGLDKASGKQLEVQSRGSGARRRFDDFLAAYDEALTETSTDCATWHVVRADRNWVKAVAVAQLLTQALERMDPQFPPAEPGIEGLTIE